MTINVERIFCGYMSVVLLPSVYATEISETEKQNSFYEFMIIDYDEGKRMNRLLDKNEKGINIETIEERFFKETGSIYIDEGRIMVDK